MSLFHKNGVITGQMNSYCLPCDVHLGTESDVRDHIADSNHKHSLDSTSYVDIYKDDGIRKVPQGYYCEYCNQLFVTSFKLKMHVSGGDHLRNKDTTWLQHHGDVVVVLNQLAIDGDSWHGLVDGACALCNSEYLDKDAHKTLSTHLLKLIQSSVELHTSGAIYRKGDNFFHCLVCNAVFSMNCFETHFEQTDHVKFYNRCYDSFKNTINNGHIDDLVTSNGNVQNSDMNTSNFNEKVDLKLSENKAIHKPENITKNQNKKQKLSLPPQEKTSDFTLCGAKEEKLPKKDCEYVAQVVERKIDDVHENLLNSIASDISEILQITVNLEDAVQKSLPNSDTDVDVINEKDILKPGGFTNKAQVYDSKEQVYEGEQSKDETSKDSQTQTTGTLQLGSPQTNKSEINIVDEKEISGLQFTNNAQVGESEVNICDREHKEITAPEDSQTQLTTGTVYSESPRNKGNEIDTTNEKELLDLQVTNNAQLSERDVNKVNENCSETIAPDHSRLITEHLHEAAPESLRNTKTEINMFNENQIKAQELQTNKPISITQQVKQKKKSKKENAELIAKANKIRHKNGYTQAFCSICNTSIPSSLKNIKLHVNSATHVRKAEQINKYTSNVIPQHEFVKQISFEQFEPTTCDVIINNTYCIDLLSYSLLTKYQSHIRCHVCDVNFPGPLMNDHQQSETHNGALKNTSVVCSLPAEFIREVQPGFYHCGFCHILEGTWQKIMDHCKLPLHAQQKLRATEKVQYFLSLTNQTQD